MASFVAFARTLALQVNTSSQIMRTFAVLSSALVVVSSLTAASPALQIPDIAQGVVDWASSQSSSSGSTKDVHASNSWTFVDCGELR
jgi:hypothetical protein